MVTLEKKPLTHDDINNILNTVLTARQKRDYESQMELNTSLDMGRYGRFRLNALRQRQFPALVIRRIISKIPSFADLRLPKILEKLSMDKRGLVPHLTGDALLVGKSTVPVGTAARLRDVSQKLAPEGVKVELAWNPEFLREGFAVADTQRPDRIVIGTDSDSADELLRQVYSNQISAGVPYLRTDLATSELVKVAANSFLATKISFINAMAEVCDRAGADVTALAHAIGYDDRIGSKFLRAGLGFGGGCLPKDIRAFMARAGELGVDDALSFLKEIDDINLRQRSRTANAAATMLGGTVNEKVIAALGAAFKPDSDDVRDSPALDVAANLHLQGANVRFDPK